LFERSLKQWLELTVFFEQMILLTMNLLWLTFLQFSLGFEDHKQLYNSASARNFLFGGGIHC